DAGQRAPRRVAGGPVVDRPGPLAMLGAIDIPARITPTPAWFALTGTTPALVAAAAAMTGPEPPPSLASATRN
ncbi:MAG TPA: hypothetical protein VFN05_06200, partial [Actinomycetes bacterium]|nr:hypothetical protein [Actinomycetes bacterium]